MGHTYAQGTMPGTKLLNQWQVAIGMPGAAVGVTIVYMGRDEERSDHTVPLRERHQRKEEDKVIN